MTIEIVSMNGQFFHIPKAFQGFYRIAIRLQSPSNGHYSYNWFYNNTTK